MKKKLSNINKEYSYPNISNWYFTTFIIIGQPVMCRLGCWKRQKRRCKCTRDSHFNWWLCSFLWWHLAKSFKICGKGETQIIYKKDVEAKYQRRKIYSASKNKSTWKYNLFRPTKGINWNFKYLYKRYDLSIV